MTGVPISWRKEFERSVAENLDTGNFRLVIVVDAMNEFLRRSIEYLNRHTISQVQAFALETPCYEWSGSKMVAPRLHGIEYVKVDDRPPIWNKVTVNRDAQERLGKRVADIINQLQELCESSDHLKYGKGKKFGSFCYRKEVDLTGQARGVVTGRRSLITIPASRVARNSSSLTWVPFGLAQFLARSSAT